MKRFAVSAGLLVLVAICLAAAVWDGSAVAGVAGDFPGDGLYGACNSFPRDTSVTVTNLENGKTVTVTVTTGVDNPGVFIALSPKAAAELGMRAGSAARIRAVAMTASQAETSLSPPRSGETSDPDFNPKVYVDREKAAVKAAAAISPPAATAGPPVEKAATAAAASPAVVAPAAAAVVQPAAVSAKPAAKTTETAEILAKVGEPKKQPVPQLPALTEPKPSSPAPKAIAATPQPQETKPVVVAPIPAPVTIASVAATPNIPADALPLPPAAFTFPGSPKPAPLGMSLPTPDLPTIPVASAPTLRGGYLAQAPEIIGGTKPQPRKPAPPRVAIVEPSVPSIAKAQAKAAEKASISALARPSTPSRTAAALALAEPALGPEELPEAILSRITAPAKLSPVPVLAEAEGPKSAVATAAGLEAIALERPSYAAAVEAALADASPASPSEAYSAVSPARAGGAGAVAELAEAELPGAPEALGGLSPAKAGGVSGIAGLAEASPPDSPDALGLAKPARTAGSSSMASLEDALPPGSPEAIGDRQAAGEGGLLAELQVPDVPIPSESLAGERPAGTSGMALAELAEPRAIEPAVTGHGPTAIAGTRPGPAQPPYAELGDPEVPNPESLAVGRPSAVEPGRALAELAEPSPAAGVASLPPAEVPVTAHALPESATAVASEKPAAVASPEAELLSPAVPSPTESIAAERPVPPVAGETTVALEPAAPRPPKAAVAVAPPVAAPIVPQAETKALPPAVVATVTSPTPSGAAQPPSSIPMLTGLAKGSFYVQIGVYGTNDALQSAIGGFRPTYPLAVERLTTKAGGAAFRLFVGPLSRDESGLVLIKIRSLGYKDAYLRQGS